ncbi:cytochrome P450 monooxygenase [Mycena capillaripes]|nr:cytochrome P450 monooxygenase [Mycena capillaripes]
MALFTAICGIFLISHGIRLLLRRIFSPLNNIPGPPRRSLITGNLSQFHDPDGSLFQQQLEQNYGAVVKIRGLFGARQLFVFDPAALHSILVKDQDIYEEMPEVMCLNRLLFGKGIQSTIREDHRKHRKIMTPAFATANLREMVPLFYEVAERNCASNLSLQLDLNSILCRSSLELIGHTGIGYSFDSMLLEQDQGNQFAKTLRALLPTAYKMQLGFLLLPFITKILPSSFLRFVINFIPLRTLHTLRDIVDSMYATAAELVRDRKAAIETGQLDDDRKDVMSLLMKNAQIADSPLHLTEDELVASTSMMIFAGTDTTAAALTRIFHILAIHTDVQEKLRAEVLSMPEQLDYDTLVALPYLDGVVHEVLRLYPPVPVMFRESTADAVLPLSTPLVAVDGTLVQSITVPKGTSIYVAIAGANRDKKIWGEDSLEFKPERWTNGKAESVTSPLPGVYGNTLTFLGGGRSCLGVTFAQLEIKVVLCVLLRAFKFSAPDPRIKWRKAGIIPSPYVENHPALPVCVERLQT